MQYQSVVRAHGTPVNQDEAKKLKALADPLRLFGRQTGYLRMLCEREMQSLIRVWRAHPELCERAGLPPGTRIHFVDARTGRMLAS